MYSQVNTAIIRGIDSQLVLVEADVSDGMPLFEMVGFLSAEVKEARERVRTSLRNIGFQLPIKRITVNISPASIRKSGTGFDLPVAIAILAAIGVIGQERLADIITVGELGLDGKINPVSGVLPIMMEAKRAGLTSAVIPRANLREAALVDGLRLLSVDHLEDVIRYLGGKCELRREREKTEEFTFRVRQSNHPVEAESYDFKNIRGQKSLRRACEIAVSGGHNLLMIGPPGAGKTMVARSIPGILPPMTREEELELSKIYSVCGLLTDRGQLMKRRPFRAPHHTISPAGLIGGGLIPKPGEISLANGGVLFLDELPEFDRATIETLRQPMEEGRVRIVRQQADVEYPADFMLVAAMNPCPCGYFPDKKRCHCRPSQVRDYLGKISQPLLDRIDLCANASPVSFDDLIREEAAESSASILDRVLQTRQIQRKRFAGSGIVCNSQIPASELKKYCALGTEEENYLRLCYERLGLTARGYGRLLRVARTIADMTASERIHREHLQEARIYHGLDRNYWKNV